MKNLKRLLACNISSDFSRSILYGTINLIRIDHMMTSYDKAKHIVEVDERILAVYVVDPVGKISDLFIAEDANIDRLFIETVQSSLNIRFEREQDRTSERPLGNHLWNILEYDKVRIIEIYESTRLIVVLAKSHLSPGDIADTVLGYLYESEEDQPRSLF
jgi:hypothetical protein